MKVKNLPNFPEKRKTINDEDAAHYKSYPYCPSCGLSETFCQCQGFNQARQIIGNLEIPRKELNKGKMGSLFRNVVHFGIMEDKDTDEIINEQVSKFLTVYKTGELDK